MRTLNPRPLPPAALRVLAVTAEDWGLRMCSPLAQKDPTAQRAAPAPTPLHAAHSTPSELQQWPYWPDYPGQAIGWR